MGVGVVLVAMSLVAHEQGQSMAGDALHSWAGSFSATGTPEPQPMTSFALFPSLQLKEEHAHVFLHQLCGLHLWAGPDHIHHAHLQACPGKLCYAASHRCMQTDTPAWPQVSHSMPGKSGCIPSLGFAFPLLRALELSPAGAGSVSHLG